MSNLKERLIFGIISSLLALVIIYFSPHEFFRPIFALLISTVISVASYEFLKMSKQKNIDPLIEIATATSFLIPFSIYLQLTYPSFQPLPAIIFFFTLFACFIYYLKRYDEAIINLSVTFFSIIYVVAPLSTWLLIAFFFKDERMFDGRMWLFYLLAVTKVTDMGAYFAGKNLGKNKLAPKISPGKTWEGAVGGLVAGTIMSVLFSIFNFLNISFIESLLLGIVLSVMGQTGDLAESLVKRDAQIKDSNTIPGLGGILDMVDSLIFTSPLVYIFLNIKNTI